MATSPKKPRNHVKSTPNPASSNLVTTKNRRVPDTSRNTAVRRFICHLRRMCKHAIQRLYNRQRSKAVQQELHQYHHIGGIDLLVLLAVRIGELRIVQRYTAVEILL